MPLIAHSILGYLYHLLIVGQLLILIICTVATLYGPLTLSVFQDFLSLELCFQPMAPHNLLKKIPSYTGRTSALKEWLSIQLETGQTIHFQG